VQLDIVPKTLCWPHLPRSGDLFVDKLTDPNPDGATIFMHAWVSAPGSLPSWYLLARVSGLPLAFSMAVQRGARAGPAAFRADPPDSAHRLDPADRLLVRHRMWGKVFIIWLGGVVPCVINAFVGVRMTNPP